MAASPRICLNMIVKDEAPIIERCLVSVLPIVDHFVISDTGSRDGTPDIIRSFFDQHGIPGTVHHGSFTDFASSRNLALDLCRETAESFDYILLTDADMELRIEGADLRQRLTEPVYALRQSNRLSYYNTRLLRREIPAWYVGVTHEYLQVQAPIARLDAAWFADHACGSSREHKVDRDICLLRAGLEEEPENARYMFYLAQTYKDAGRLTDAAQWYTRRIEAGGWAEERWYAMYMRAVCHRGLGETAEFVQGCLEAYGLRPTRAEPLHALARHYRESGQNEACMLICEAGERIPYPEDDMLFIEDAVYRTGFGEEASIAGFYCVAPERRAWGREACLALGIDRGASEPTRATARRNVLFYTRPAAELFGGCAFTELSVDLGDGWRVTNPSICWHQGRLQGILRAVNYTLEGHVYSVIGGEGPIRTVNLFATFDDVLRIADLRQVWDRTLANDWAPSMRLPVEDLSGERKDSRAAAHSPIMNLPRFPTAVRGFEDCRLISWRERLWCSASARDTNPDWRLDLALLELDKARDVIAAHVNGTVHPELHQRNWVPLVAGDDLLFLYTTDPMVVVRFSPEDTGAESDRFTVVHNDVPALALDHLRGGSQAVTIPGGWLYLTHEVVEDVLPTRAYLHRFVQLDHGLRVVAVSEPFYFLQRGIEFVCGMVFDAAHEKLIISLGISDAKAYLACLDARLVLAALGAVRPPSNPPIEAQA